MKSGITFVSAFLCGTTPKRRTEVYKRHFDHLASTGIPIVLFLDRRMVSWSFPETVRVVPVSLDETWIGQTVSPDSVLPPRRDPVDTLEYMAIQATKVEWMRRATEVNPWNTEWFAWIDFGIVHVFKTPEATLARLSRLAPPPTPGLRTAGIWTRPTSDVWTGICWRFAGGFLMGDVASVRRLDSAVRELVRQEQPRFAWEVNLWALLESRGLDFGWFPADHTDSIIPEDRRDTVSIPAEEPPAI